MRASGFTLLETLVVLVLTGLIVAGLAEGTRAGLSAWSGELRASRLDTTGQTTARLLRGLIVRMDPGDPTDPMPVVGRASSLAFTTDLPALPPGQRTEEASVAILLDHHDLVLRWTPRPPAPFHKLEPRETVIEPGVGTLAFSYWRGHGWTDHWGGDGVPPLVRLRLTMSGGTPADETPPDLVAAPYRGWP